MPFLCRTQHCFFPLQRQVGCQFKGDCFTGKKLYSYRLVEHTFWWTSLGLIGFYSTLLFFGFWEGSLLLADQPEAMEEAHKYYGRTIAFVATAMGMGFWIYFANVFMTYKKVTKE